MKTFYPYTRAGFLLLLIFFLIKSPVNAQGRVVINEYMPWTPASCGATSDFVELLNFGPGPMNIGCYVITDGDFSITIPPNTILQPGQFYVISGQDVLPQPCGNVDSTIHAHLNWNTCNCTSGAIPTTGDGFLTDGGSANEQLVLMDPSFNVIDAVVRSFPVESSSLITTSSMGGQCSPGVFDLDLMGITYETIGESAGRGNSFARRLDGDCGWVKDPPQSGNATNNTPGDASDVTYSLTVLETQACPYGSIVVTVNSPDGYGDIFPMTYTLAFDSNHNGIFELGDYYTYGSDNSPNTIQVNNLPAGTYRITLASAGGCYLKTFEFIIFECFPVLPLKLLHFEVKKNPGELLTTWGFVQQEELETITIERSHDGILFRPAVQVPVVRDRGDTVEYTYGFPLTGIYEPYFRLHMRDRDNRSFYSPVVLTALADLPLQRLWPNPAHSFITITYSSASGRQAEYLLLNIQNQVVGSGSKFLFAGLNEITIPVNNLPRGNYYLLVIDRIGKNTLLRSSFIKH